MKHKKLLLIGAGIVGFGILALAIATYYPIDERLRMAALHGNTVKVFDLAKRGANVNARDRNGVTSLILASAAGRNETARELLRLGADVRMSVHPGYSDTALYYAVLNNHPEMVRILLAAGADPNAKMGGFYSPIIIASSRPSNEVMRALASSPRLNVNDRDDRGNNPIMLVVMSDAAQEQKVISLKLLLGHGGDPEATNSKGETACSLACRTKQPAIIETLGKCDCGVPGPRAGDAGSSSVPRR